MTRFVEIFVYLSVLLCGLAFSFEALTIGGIIFLFAVARQIAGEEVSLRIRRWICCASILLALTTISLVALNSAILLGSTDLQPADIITGLVLSSSR